MNKTNSLSFARTSIAIADNESVQVYVSDRKYYLVAKRIFDIIISAIFLVVIGSWLFPIMALAILMDSRGPVFFFQNRLGQDGKIFRCIKFRTMFLNSLADKKQAEENDPRITKIGRFLRVSSLDELPQFFNVLKGEMSIVGPRPHMLADCEKFSNHIPAYTFRHYVKPGITGLAQVKGFRGPTVDFESMFHRYQFDAFYVRNCNFWLDVRIIRQTFTQTLKVFYAPVQTLGSQPLS